MHQAGAKLQKCILYEGVREEIFEPVAVIIKFKDAEDVIKMANDSEYGLGGGIFTKDITKAINVARRVETGRMC